jgi:SpoIID/LytB domain protein
VGAKGSPFPQVKWTVKNTGLVKNTDHLNPSLSLIDKAFEKVISLLMAIEVKNEPRITVGIMERRNCVEGRLHGTFTVDGIGPETNRKTNRKTNRLTNGFSAKAAEGSIVLCDAAGRVVGRSPHLRIKSGGRAFFDLFNVTIGSRFHWERSESQTFRGDLILRSQADGAMAAINEVPLEDYLESVISSEMNASAPGEMLKSHAILSRSWLLAALRRKQSPQEACGTADHIIEREGEVVRWYGREEHDLFDVCADDHCQRYHGVTRITSREVRRAVRETRGMVLTWGDEVCDARYSKACGGLTEEFETAWDDARRPYLISVADGPVPYPAVTTELEAARWCLSAPGAYCNTKDKAILENILPAFDRETENFFRWTVEYSPEELGEILYEKSGFDFGRLQAIVPLARGPSGRIFRLRIVGSKMSMIVGKELEIRRWLSRSHLYSSAFVVQVAGAAGLDPERFVFHGSGWGHGVGLCQIGAAVMASRGVSAEQIVGHYFPGATLQRLY